jgi:hypothetical protein
MTGLLLAAGFLPTAAEERSAFVGAASVPALRSLATDRPDQTESPYTVDAGHWQVETDVASCTMNRVGAVRTTAWSFGAFNLKFGVARRADLQWVVEPWVSERTENLAGGGAARTSGTGDVTTRLKFNLWGNDGGPTALAVMPFVKWPLRASGVRNGRTEGGVAVPFARGLPAGWSLGAMTEIDFVAADAGGRDTEWLNSVTLSRDLTDRLGFYVEFVGVLVPSGGGKRRAQADVGLTCALGGDAQLDCGANFGVNAAAPDLQFFSGISRRF